MKLRQQVNLSVERDIKSFNEVARQHKVLKEKRGEYVPREADVRSVYQSLLRRTKKRRTR